MYKCIRHMLHFVYSIFHRIGNKLFINKHLQNIANIALNLLL